MITLKEAKELQIGDKLYCTQAVDSKGLPCVWRVSGKPITWKRAPHRVKVPIKHGLYDSDYLSERDLDLVSLHD